MKVLEFDSRALFRGKIPFWQDKVGNPWMMRRAIDRLGVGCGGRARRRFLGFFLSNG
jgi:hypothetical protein